MYVMDDLTEEQIVELQEAQDKITTELLESLNYGDEIKVTEHYTLYHYCEDEIIVLNRTEDWEEVLQVLYGETDDDIIFEAL